MKNYINGLVDNGSIASDGITKFIVPGWSVKSDWNDTPLEVLYTDVWIHDANLCALWLGLFVMQVIIERSEKWYVIKTVFEGRTFEQACYWTKDDPDV